MVKLVDTRDLKSLERKSSCRFKSGPGHQYKKQLRLLFILVPRLPRRQVGKTSRMRVTPTTKPNMPSQNHSTSQFKHLNSHTFLLLREVFQVGQRWINSYPPPKTELCIVSYLNRSTQDINNEIPLMLLSRIDLTFN